MKMVAASKLRRAQEQAEASQPYAQAMASMLARVAANVTVGPGSSPLLTGTGSEQRHLLVVVTSDRGLCGGFNANAVRAGIKALRELRGEGKDVRLVCVGRKAYDSLRREYPSLIEKSFTGIGGKAGPSYEDAHKVTRYILDKFEAGAFDVCSLVYNEFKNVLVQKPVVGRLIPFALPEVVQEETPADTGPISPYAFEPDEEALLGQLLPRNIGVQIFRALLDSAAGEQAARMTAMDNATRNAGDMIRNLSLQYNRARQAHITRELIEIISGAEAL